jgi:hypothetical protein
MEAADSLKDKRQVVRSLLQHLRNKFNISAAEVEDLHLWRRATIGVAVISNDARFANKVLSQVVNHVEVDPRAVLEDYALEIVPFSESQSSTDGFDETTEDFSEWFSEQAKDSVAEHT